MQDKDKFTLTGHIVGLLAHSKLHSKYPIESLNQVFLPPVAINQFRMYYKDGGLPVGFVTWASLSDEIHKKYKEGTYQLQLKDWNSGDNLWIIDLVAPFGHMKQVYKDLRQNIFVGKTGHFMKIVDEQKKEWKVSKFRGSAIKT